MNSSRTDELETCIVAGTHRIPLADEGRLALLLVRVGAVLGTIGDERLAKAGLSGRDYEILAILDTDGPGSQHELAELIGKAPGVVVAAIDDMEKRGLVGRERDPSDRRRSRVVISDKGSAALSAADEIAEEAVAEVLKGLDGAGRRRFAKTLAAGLGLPVRRPTPAAS